MRAVRKKDFKKTLALNLIIKKAKNEIINIKDQLAATDDELMIKQLEERIAKIQAQLGEVEKPVPKKDGFQK